MTQQRLFADAPFRIIAWNQGWLAADKPGGISVHNAPGQDMLSILMRFLQTRPETHAAIGFDPGYGLHAAHRLDQETSGVLMLASRPETARHLADQFVGGRVVKHYLALVHGHVTAPGPAGRSLAWRWPLTRAAAGRRNPQGGGQRLESCTRASVLSCSAHYSLIQCEPLTGRKHQIRRHAALAGHPVCGDRRYGPRRAWRYLEQHHGFNRLALHATALQIQPAEGAALQRFESPSLPQEIQRLLDEDKIMSLRSTAASQ